ncbi:hypothetical protein EYF80_055970 [Liparis tanakae]|uniref:Uncharacterized protein n=1 Tax=Liparis tanakae TaxID=230148 RepID=A0A4Z2EY45_9TELE|nr:hypothetical protein EYF80_055970 [Liparis tanakae]
MTFDDVIVQTTQFPGGRAPANLDHLSRAIAAEHHHHAPPLKAPDSAPADALPFSCAGCSESGRVTAVTERPTET